MTTVADVQFTGTKREQELAQQVFEVLRRQGSLFAQESAIRQSLENLVAYLAPQRGQDPTALAAELDAALRQNSAVFGREESEGGVIYTTTRTGRLPGLRDEIAQHLYQKRLFEPEHPLPTDDISVVVSLNRPALTTVEPVFISDYWQLQVGPIDEAAETEETLDLVAEAELVAEEPLDLVAEETLDLVAEDVPAAEETLDLVAEDVPAAEVIPAPVAEVQTPVQVPVQTPVQVPGRTPVRAPMRTGAISSAFTTLSDGTVLDLSLPLDAIMAEHSSSLTQSLRASIEADPLRRIVFFGNDAFPEAGIINLGKNDLRRIRDYIVEVGEPVSDSQVISDLYNRRNRDDEFERMRFSLNYRLGREKDFTFVGVEGGRLWSVSGLPTIGTKRIKASEMAQIMTYLTEGYDDSLQTTDIAAIKQAGKIDSSLTFFEWQYGILPLTAALQALLPPPLLEGQRTSVLRFESPQHYSGYPVELRYATGNRGGWLQGLEEFFAEYLVPGALLTIARTEEPNIFTMSYTEAPATSERLLTLDEKKNKLVFANRTFYSVVDPDLLPTQQRYGKLKNLKSLPMAERRKEEDVLEHVFETIGEKIGTRSEPLNSASLDELLISMNVLRPTSRALLTSTLERGERFEAEGEGRYLYKPEPEAQDADEPEGETEDEFDDQFDDDE